MKWIAIETGRSVPSNSIYSNASLEDIPKDDASSKTDRRFLVYPIMIKNSAKIDGKEYPKVGSVKIPLSDGTIQTFYALDALEF